MSRSSGLLHVVVFMDIVDMDTMDMVDMDTMDMVDMDMVNKSRKDNGCEQERPPPCCCFLSPTTGPDVRIAGAENLWQRCPQQNLYCRFTEI